MTTTQTTTRLRDIIQEELPGLIEFRRDLHAHPELMFQEKRTSQQVRTQLEKCEIPFVANLAGGTGVLGHLPGDRVDRTVALRADMDALPIVEETGLPYASKSPGVMHACGHDGHTTICLGAAKVLKRISDEIGLPRPVKFVFQPAEEGGHGGERMVEDGCLTDAVLGPAVTEMFGLHCWPELPIGSVASRPGPLLAATDQFDVKITGKMAHAAQPHLSADPIVCGAAIVQSLQSIASRNVNPVDSIVLSVTQFIAGSAYNVIPEEAVLRGTMRTLVDATRELGRHRFYEVCEQIASAHRCSAEIKWHVGYPVTNNHPDAVEKFFKRANAAVGCEKTQLVPDPSLGGEDFAYYGREVPSCFFLLGQQVDADTPYPNVHTPQFNFNDDSIALGVEMFCRLALELDED